MEIIITSDGSHSVYSSQFDESYHSTFGAIQESEHIFINTALKQVDRSPIHVLEIGFGTGLNAFLTTIHSDTIPVYYTSLELYPLSYEEAMQLNFSSFYVGTQTVFEAIHQAEWGEFQQITETCFLRKIHADALSYDIGVEEFDVVYFDAFSPEKHPSMWSEQFFSRIFDACKKGAVLSTYCSKGYVRRILQSVGFSVERLPGPIGKRQILRATK